MSNSSDNGFIARMQGTLAVRRFMHGWVLEKKFEGKSTYFPMYGKDWVPLLNPKTDKPLANLWADKDKATDFMFELLMSRYQSHADSPKLTEFWMHQARVQEGQVVVTK